ncbi:MAG: 50S ribosomal protein L25 [Syntrophomonas sp.]|nr:50S ribosomal protein L25 [Syntrophomonas sp.]
MAILKAEERNTSLKAKQLRKIGIIPGVLYDNHPNESLSIQFSRKDVEILLRTHSIGNAVDLMLGEKKRMVLLKEITYTTVTNQVEHMSLMPLIKGKKITSVAQIVLLNQEEVLGNVQQSLFEISYKAIPSDLIEKIEIDLKTIAVGDSIRVADLEISKNEAIEILTSPDNMVCSIMPFKTAPEEVLESDQEEQ